MAETSKNKKLAVATGAVCLLALIGYLNKDNESPKATVADKRREAVVICQMHAKKSLKNPSSADFPWGDQVKPLGNDEYILASYVEAENSFGATVRTEYSCQVKYAGGGAQGWRIIDFRIF